MVTTKHLSRNTIPQTADIASSSLKPRGHDKVGADLQQQDEGSGPTVPIVFWGSEGPPQPAEQGPSSVPWYTSHP